MKTAYLSLGSNLGDREANLRRALELLATSGLHVKRTSSIYETEPQGLTHQPWFLNLAVEIETTLFPLQLLARIQKVEKELGRKRTVAKGPRSLDIDILLIGNFVIESTKLTVPHPRMHLRRFVLAPLAELAPDLRHPVLRCTIRDLLGSVTGQIVKKIR